jgi:hypothetical protein
VRAETENEARQEWETVGFREGERKQKEDKITKYMRQPRPRKRRALSVGAGESPAVLGTLLMTGGRAPLLLGGWDGEKAASDQQQYHPRVTLGSRGQQRLLLLLLLLLLVIRLLILFSTVPLGEMYAAGFVLSAGSAALGGLGLVAMAMGKRRQLGPDKCVPYPAAAGCNQPGTICNRVSILLQSEMTLNSALQLSSPRSTQAIANRPPSSVKNG